MTIFGTVFDTDFIQLFEKREFCIHCYGSVSGLKCVSNVQCLFLFIVAYCFALGGKQCYQCNTTKVCSCVASLSCVYRFSQQATLKIFKLKKLFELEVCSISQARTQVATNRLKHQ